MSTNNITGDNIITPPPTDAYRDNYERIFTKPKGDLENTDGGEYISDSGETDDPIGTTSV